MGLRAWGWGGGVLCHWGHTLVSPESEAGGLKRGSSQVLIKSRPFWALCCWAHVWLPGLSPEIEGLTSSKLTCRELCLQGWSLQVAGHVPHRAGPCGWRVRALFSCLVGWHMLVCSVSQNLSTYHSRDWGSLQSRYGTLHPYEGPHVGDSIVTPTPVHQGCCPVLPTNVQCQTRCLARSGCLVSLRRGFSHSAIGSHVLTDSRGHGSVIS